MSSYSIHITRRSFLKAISILGLSSCSPFLPKTRFMHLLTTDPDSSQYNPILRSLIELILPFEHPNFPDITIDTIMKNIDIHFPLTEERQEPFQRAFMLFNDIQLFKEKLPIIADEESKLFEEFENLKEDKIKKRINQILLNDQLLFSNFEKKHGHLESFLTSPKEAQGDYFHLWSQSGFNIKRMFFNSTKGVINACTYSDERVWKVMGYNGPIDKVL